MTEIEERMLESEIWKDVGFYRVLEGNGSDGNDTFVFDALIYVFQFD